MKKKGHGEAWPQLSCQPIGRYRSGSPHETQVPALSLTVTVAEYAIARPGVKVTLIVQLPPTARPVPPIGQLFVCANRPGLVPPSEIRVITTEAAPVFVTVTTCGRTGCVDRLRSKGNHSRRHIHRWSNSRARQGHRT